MSHHQEISRICRSFERRELRNDILRIEGIYHVLVLRSYKRIVLIKHDCISAKAFKPLHKVFPYFRPLLGMSHGVVFLGHYFDILYYTGCRKALMICWSGTWTRPHSVCKQCCENYCERE